MDTKLKTSGAIAFFISGGSAYAISSVLSDSSSRYNEDIEEEVEEEDGEEYALLQRSGQPAPQYKNIEQKLRNYKFSLIKEESGDIESKWEEHATKISKKIGTVTKEQIKKTCEERYGESYKKNVNWSKLKEAIRKCVVLDNFRERARKLDIKLIEDSDQTSTLWEARFKKMQEKRLQEVADYTTVLITGWHRGALTTTDLQNFCKTVGNINWTQVSKDKSTKQEFSNYLEGCAEKENLDISFWKGKPYKNLASK